MKDYKTIKLKNVINLVKPIFTITLYFLLILLISCNEEIFPKPIGYLRIERTPVMYERIKTNCPFQFEIPLETNLLVNEKCWMKIKYPKLKATIDITYRPIKNNLRELLLESEKLTTKHSVKADKISYSPMFEDNIEKVYGRISDVLGNAASPLQFYVTDSLNHFITGAVYFNVQPNYDSIYPSVKYLEKDIKQIIESTRWQ